MNASNINAMGIGYMSTLVHKRRNSNTENSFAIHWTTYQSWLTISVSMCDSIAGVVQIILFAMFMTGARISLMSLTINDMLMSVRRLKFWWQYRYAYENISRTPVCYSFLKPSISSIFHFRKTDNAFSTERSWSVACGGMVRVLDSRLRRSRD